MPVRKCSTTARRSPKSNFWLIARCSNVIAHLAIVIGEALRRAERLDGSLAESIPQIRDVIDTQNRIVHGYDSINYELLWDIAIEDVSPLKHLVD